MKFERLVFLIIAAYGLTLAGMERPETGGTLFGLGLILAACIATNPDRLRVLMAPFFSMKIVAGLATLVIALRSNANVAIALGEIATAVAVAAVYARLRWPEKIIEAPHAVPPSLSTTLGLIRQETTREIRLAAREQ